MIVVSFISIAFVKKLKISEILGFHLPFTKEPFLEGALKKPRGAVVYYCTTSFNKSRTQVLRKFKTCSRRVGDSQW